MCLPHHCKYFKLKVLSEIAERTEKPEAARGWLERLLDVDPMNDDAREALQRIPVEPMDLPAGIALIDPDEEARGGGDVGPLVTGDAPPDATEVMANDAVPAYFPVPTEAAPAAAVEDVFAAAETAQPDAVEIEPVEVEPSPSEDVGHEAVVENEDAPGPDFPVLDAIPADPGEPTADLLEPVEGSSSEEPTPAEPIEAAEAVAEAGAETDQVAPVTESPAIEEPVSSAEPAAPDETPLVVEETLEITPVGDSSLVTHVEETTLKSGPSDPAGVVGTDVEVDEPIELEARSPPEADQAADLLQGMATEGPIEGGPAEAAVEPAAVEGMPSTDVVTETMAEVYLKQGLIAEARDIYRRLAEQRPDDSAIRARLADLEAREETRVEPMPAAPRYSTAFTGGRSTRAFLAGVLSATSGRATDREEPTPPPAATEEPTPLDSALGTGAAEEIPGAPTQPAPDSVSLASVFGDEETPAAGPTESAPPPSEGGMSFDDFFGEAPPAEPSEPSPDTASGQPEVESDDQFKDWLKGLKS